MISSRSNVHSRPVIGVTTQTLEPVGVDLPRCWVMSQRYVRVLASVGAVPWVIPLLENDEATLREIYERLDGLFLPGGVDIDPACYAETREDLCGRTDPARDWAELALIRWAIEDRKPVLAVCRGVQLLNVAAGGTLYQDLQTHHKDAIKHDYYPGEGPYEREYLSHTVRVSANSQLARLLETDSLEVNSMHHQGIKRLSPKLVATAFAPDGLIEGVESASGDFVIGVQWHPEDLADSDPRMRRLFTEFIEAAEQYAHA